MIVFLFGTWGAGKSYIGHLIEENCGIPHMEGDLQFTDEMVAAIYDRTFHTLDLDDFYGKVVNEIRSYMRRTPHMVVSQGIYHERYRQMLYERFAPNIAFLLVHTPDQDVRNERLEARVEEGSPVTPGVWEYMAHHWEIPKIPFEVVLNDHNMERRVQYHLRKMGLCGYWGQ